MYRAAAYIRWSTEEQGEGTTLEVQLEACRLFIQSQGWTFRDDLVFIDDGYSGSTLDRPGLARLRRAIANRQVDCVVVYKLDRLSRSVLDTVNLVLQEWEGLCTLRSAREPIDTASPTGAVFFYMLASYAEWERSTIRERTLSGKIRRAQQGRNPGFTPPYGYRRGATPGTLSVCEEEAAVVRRIFREFTAGRGVHAVAASLDHSGIRPRRAERWRGESILKLIANPIYKGVLQYGRSAAATRAQRREGRIARVRLAAPRYANVEGAVPAILSADEWDRAQAVRAGRRAVTGTRARSAVFLLTGIARCRCGATIRGDARGSRRYYRCSGQLPTRPDPCSSALIPAQQLDDAVVSRVRAAMAPDQRELLLAEWQADARRRQQELAAEETGLRSALTHAEQARSRVASDYRNGELPARLYAEQTEALDRDISTLQKRIAELSDGRRALTAQQPAEPFLHQVDLWDQLEPEERKQLLRHVVARCTAFRPRGAQRSRPEGRLSVELLLRLPRSSQGLDLLNINLSNRKFAAM